MAFNTFTPPQNPSAPIKEKFETRIARAQFGDGYEQDAAKGINSVRSVVTLRWDNLEDPDAQTIIDFARNQEFQPFYYTLPQDTTQKKWVATEWSRTAREASISSVQMTIRESFEIDV